MRHLRTTTLLACVAFAIPMACGGGDSSDPIKTGIDKTKPVSQMTPAEEQELCEAVQETATEKLQSSDVQKGLCGAMAYSAASTSVDMEMPDIAAAAAAGAPATDTTDPAATCQQAYDECMAQPPTDTTETIDAEACNISDLQCEATVGEIEDCLNELVSFIPKLLKALPDCSDVGQTYDPSTAVSSAPKKCLELQAKCPEAFASATTSGDDLDSATQALSFVKRVLP